MSGERKVISDDKLAKKTKKQTSLLKYAGFSKEIVHNNTKYKIVDSGFVEGSGGVYKCPSCSEMKKTKQALSQHIMWRHSDNSSPKSEAAEKIARYVSEKQQITEEKEINETYHDYLYCGL